MIDLTTLPTTALLTAPQTAEVLSVPLNTLNIWRTNGRVGLPYIKIGRQVRYQVGDLLAFMEEGRRGKAA